jgi:uroporphyrinogen decarboxylase
MSNWNRFDRFSAILSGEPADRPAVAAWQHFVPDEAEPKALAAATQRYTEQFDWDWVKINPRFTYLPEVWGFAYDYSDYTDVAPRLVKAPITGPDQLDRITPQRVTVTPSLAEQLELVRRLRAAIPDRPLLQTVFSPWSQLLYFVGGGQTAQVDPLARPSVAQGVIQAAGADNVHRALTAITQTVANYITEVVRAGADGVFYAVLGSAAPGQTTAQEFAAFSTPYDLEALEAAQGHHVVLHTCGAHSDPARFAGYPAQAIHWDQHAEGNPGLDLDLNQALVGGVSNDAIRDNDVALVERQAGNALAATAGRPFLLAPACSTPITASAAALTALRTAVETPVPAPAPASAR